jgi:putative transposase
MKIHPEVIYHIYNRGNNKQAIFFQERNYNFFLDKVKKELDQHLIFLAYCLMPNHFHFLVLGRATIKAEAFSNSFRILLSSYTRAIQKQEGFTGSLFQQNSKAKEVVNEAYARVCFNYIHQNPITAGLVNRLEDWKFSSFAEYWQKKPLLCSLKNAHDLLDLPQEGNSFYQQSYESIPKNIINKLF